MMALRQLRLGDDEILRKKCREVEKVDDRIRELLEDMMDTLHTTENGAALAASQIGILKRLVVVDMGGPEGPMKLVNPRIVATEGTQKCIEGCLSFPGRFGRTVRPAKVTVEALDEWGKPLTLTGEDDLAKCYCHEIDHLDGKVFIDIVTEYLD